jgi:hypothetical protein
MRVILFVEGITKVVNDAPKEPFSDEPRHEKEVPFLLSTLALVGERGVRDGGIVRCQFVGDDVRVDAGELVILIGAEDVAKQTIVVGCVL